MHTNFLQDTNTIILAERFTIKGDARISVTSVNITSGILEILDLATIYSVGGAVDNGLGPGIFVSSFGAGGVRCSHYFSCLIIIILKGHGGNGGTGSAGSAGKAYDSVYYPTKWGSVGASFTGRAGGTGKQLNSN